MAGWMMIWMLLGGGPSHYGPFPTYQGVPVPYNLPLPILKHPLIQRHFNEEVIPYHQREGIPLSDSFYLVRFTLWPLVYFPVRLSTLEDTVFRLFRKDVGDSLKARRLLVFFYGTALFLADTGYVVDKPDPVMPCWEGIYRYHVKEVLWQAPWSTFKVNPGTWVTLYSALPPGDSGKRLLFPGGRWMQYRAPSQEDLRFPMLVSLMITPFPPVLSRCKPEPGRWVPDRFPRRRIEWVIEPMDGDTVLRSLYTRRIYRFRLSEIQKASGLIRSFFQRMEEEVRP